MKKYTLFGKNIVFDDAAERAYEIKVNYEFVELRISQEFQAWYKEQNTIQNVINNFVDFVNTAYSELLVSDKFHKLQECGIYDMTADMYARKCLSFSGAQYALDTVESQYDAITEQQHAEKEYREARKASRGRWRGGGFGLGGALKGAATAGALNAVSGLGHDLVNSAGNLSSALDASNAKSDLYKSASTVLLNGLYEDMRTFFDNHIQLLTTAKPGYFKFYFDEERANALFTNAKQLPDKRAELLEQAFELCPWNEDLQRYIFRNYPENRRDILRASTDFGIGIYDCVEELLRKEYTEEDKKSEERALQAKSRILKIMADLNVPQTRVLDELEVDCLHRLCPDLKNANEVTCNNYIEAIQAYDAQEQNKQIVINEINARLDEIWSVEDDAACKALYLNTDIRIPEQVQRAIERIKEKSRTKAHEPYVKALQECSEKSINTARKYHRGIIPKVYATIAWTGLLLSIINIGLLHTGTGITICGIAILCVFSLMYLMMNGTWSTLTIDETAIHVALTEHNQPTNMKVPAIVLSIPLAILLAVGAYFGHSWQTERAEAERLQALADERKQEWEESHAAEESENTVSDTPVKAPVNINDYYGKWTVDLDNSDSDLSINFTIEDINSVLSFSANAIWGQGDRVITIDPISITMNEAETQADGYYRDSRDDTGAIILDFENNEMYITITSSNTHAWDISVQHAHCTRAVDSPLSDAMSTLSEAQINAITYRIYEENEFGASIAMQGQIMNRQNWRNYEQALLDTLVDRIGNYDMSGIDPNYTAEQKLAAWMTVLPNDPNTGVITCQISRASFEQWMAANYDVDTSIAPQAGIYDSNDQCIIRGSQGYIDDDINVYNIHSIDDSTFYVQFEKTYPTDSTSDGYGYAVVHMDNLDDQHFTIWELGWDTESISEQSLAAYKN